MGLSLASRAAGFTTSLAPITSATSHCGMSGLISSISTSAVYGMFASASSTFMWPGIRPATGWIANLTVTPRLVSWSYSSRTLCWAWATHKVRELYDQLTKRGVTVKFAIHPVAGRMPGHMNVLLAEANIPYTALVEMEEINPDMPQCDVALVIGANDVVNPAARYAKGSPIYGMPIIDADKAKTVLAIKRSKNPGFAGIDNELYVQDNTWMLFGDAKQVIGDLVKQFAGGGLH